MVGKELIIDESNCKELQKYFRDQGIEMENIISQYISILQVISDSGIVSGDVSNALKVYVVYACKMKGEIENISEAMIQKIDFFVQDMKDTDKLTF